ncbi:MAG TPA: hypothetical protein VFN76_00775 [Candidatus Limnocylindria bacterium]|nr:hypothetical protein [Candidatus Limnocylindria bacterium]
MRRAAGIVTLSALLAACAAPGTGGGATEPAGTGAAGAASMNPSSSPASSATAEEGAATRVDIGALSDDPSSFTGHQIKVLARVDQVLVDGLAFLTSPSASEEGQIAVLVRPDAQVDKDIVEGTVVWVEGTVVGLTEQELSDAGLDITLDQLGDFDGEFAIVADSISDPLASND